MDAAVAMPGLPSGAHDAAPYVLETVHGAVVVDPGEPAAEATASSLAVAARPTAAAILEPRIPQTTAGRRGAGRDLGTAGGRPHRGHPQSQRLSFRDAAGWSLPKICGDNGPSWG
jgi:hypothetical protein